MKNIFKKCRGMQGCRDVGMAMPKTTETRCRDYTKTTQVTPSLHLSFFFWLKNCSSRKSHGILTHRRISGIKKVQGWSNTQVTPSLHLFSSFFAQKLLFPEISQHNSQNDFRYKKGVGMGLPVQSLYIMPCLHTAIPTPCFCGFLAWPSLHPSTFFENAFYTSQIYNNQKKGV